TVRQATPEVRWVDMATGRLSKAWPLPKGFRVCGFSRDGRLALLGNGEAFHLWDLSHRWELRTFEGKGQLGLDVLAYFSPDAKVVATAICVNHIPGLVRVWDVGSGRQLWESGKLGAPRGQWILGFLPDREALVVKEENNRINLRDCASGQILRSFPTMEV